MKRFFKKRHLVKAYDDVFNDSQSGKLVLHDLLRTCHVFRSTVSPGATESTHAMAFKEGERNVALRILGFLNYSEEDLQKMASEAKHYQIGEDYE